MASSEDAQTVEATVDLTAESLTNAGEADAVTEVIPQLADGQDGAQADAGAGEENPPVDAEASSDGTAPDPQALSRNGAESPAEAGEAEPEAATEAAEPAPMGADAEIPAEDGGEAPSAADEAQQGSDAETPAEDGGEALTALDEAQQEEADVAPSAADEAQPEQAETEQGLGDSQEPINAGGGNAGEPIPEGGPAQDSANSRTVRIAILSDLHYVTDQLLKNGDPDLIYAASQSESRLLEEIDAVVSEALNGAAAVSPDALVVCGDMVSNGELLGARALAEKLKNAKKQEGLENTGIYVVNGNHDINNSYAADFRDETVGNAQRVQPEDFSTIFAGLGYGEDDHWANGSHSVYVPTTDDPTKMTNHGGLSYVSDIAEGVTLIVLDTAVYRTDKTGENSWYNEAQRTAGLVSDDLLQWAKTQAETAKANGNLVLCMCHQAMIPHYERELEEDVAWYMKETLISNWEEVAETLADAGVTAVLTGHSHTNDIAKYVSKNNNVLYDIETASLSAYPCAWRTMEITIDGEGEEQTYSFAINTSRVDGDIAADTSEWRFVIGGERRTFDDYYKGNLLDYAYDKTGITESMFGPAAGYLLKSYLYDMVKHEGGIGGYIEEKAGLEEGQTLGDLAISTIAKHIGKLSSIAMDFSVLGSTMTLRTGEVKNVPDEGATDEQLAQNMVSLDVSLDYSGGHEEGAVSLDLSYVRTAVGGFMEKLQKTLSEGAWMTNPYAATPLVDDAANLVANAMLPALTKPMEGADPDYPTALEMINDAWQADAYGDEELADEDTKKRWEKERELLLSDALGTDITSGFLRQLSEARSNYKAIYELMESQRLVGEGKNSLFQVELKNSPLYLGIVSAALKLDSMQTLADILQPVSMLNTLGISLPGSLAKPIQEKVAALHQTKTKDTNIPHDNEWDFHIVNFNANGGSVSQTSATTVEDGKLVSLPQPGARTGYTFAGWFTSPTGGNPIGAGDDLSGIHTLYAHWTYTGIPEEETDRPEDGANPAEDGANPAEDGANRPEDGANRPEDGTNPPEDGTNPPEDGVNPPEDGADDSAAPNSQEERKHVARARSPMDLHVRFFGSVQAAHAHIHDIAANDPAYAAFCGQFASRLTQTADGSYEVDLGSWLLLDSDAVLALQACGADVAVTFTCQGHRFRFILPAGFDFVPLADENGSVCVLCLAEALGLPDHKL